MPQRRVGRDEFYTIPVPGRSRCLLGSRAPSHELYWQITKMGFDYEVIASSLIPKQASDKVKTDRRDTGEMVQSCQVGDVTPVWVPTPEHESLRGLARQRARRQRVRSAAARKRGPLPRTVRWPIGAPWKSARVSGPATSATKPPHPI